MESWFGGVLTSVIALTIFITGAVVGLTINEDKIKDELPIILNKTVYICVPRQFK